MTASYFLKGLIIGFSIAAPVGPIGILCLRRTIANGRMSGFVSGLGAACADMVHGFVAGFGLTFISDVLMAHQMVLRLAGGVFLLYLGVKTFLSEPSPEGTTAGERGLLDAYLSTFFLTLTNPITILAFAAIFSGLGLLQGPPGYTPATLLVLGVFTGSTLWWSILSGGAGLFHNRIGLRGLRWLNRISGVTISAFGIAAILVAALL